MVEVPMEITFGTVINDILGGVKNARKTNVELLLSNHPDDCLYCERNGSCELQSFAEDLNIRERRMPGKKSPHKIDNSSPALIRDPIKCILCGRCVRVCEEIMNTSSFDFAYRGNELQISITLSKPLNFSSCTACGQCLISCPTGALIEHIQFPELDEHIHAPGKVVVAQYTPAVAISVAELLGYKTGTNMGGIINAILRRYGFDYVFETASGAEVMVLEQAKIYAERMSSDHEYPLITSSCPAWVQFVEQLEPESSDAPFFTKSTAGFLTGVAGGESEATIRILYNQMTGKELESAKLHRFRIHKHFREMTVNAGDIEIKVGCVSGLSNAVELLENLKSGKRKLDLLEVMACPDGCINGGGQPLSSDERIIRTRSKAVYENDNDGILNTAHNSPQIERIYNEFLTEPGSLISKENLHTTFTKREVL